MDYLLVKFVTFITGVAVLYYGIMAVPRNLFVEPQPNTTTTSTAQTSTIKTTPTSTAIIIIKTPTSTKVIQVPVKPKPKPPVVKPPIIVVPAPTPPITPAPPTPTPEPTPTGISLAGILEATNAERAAVGVAPLKNNTTLNQVATVRVNDMFKNQYFSHDAPDGTTFVDTIKDVDYRYFSVGENLALGDFSTNQGIVTAWLNSPGHRANMLNDNYTEIGIAIAKRSYEDRDQWIAVQIFGRPR